MTNITTYFETVNGLLSQINRLAWVLTADADRASDPERAANLMDDAKMLCEIRSELSVAGLEELVEQLKEIAGLLV